jgi:hypothetical protein
VNRHDFNREAASGLRHLLQAYDRERTARIHYESWRSVREITPDARWSAADEQKLTEAHKALVAACAVLDAAIVAFTDHIYDLAQPTEQDAVRAAGGY